MIALIARYEDGLPVDCDDMEVQYLDLWIASMRSTTRRPPWLPTAEHLLDRVQQQRSGGVATPHGAVSLRTGAACAG
jgi:hypothetical protein